MSLDRPDTSILMCARTLHEPWLRLTRGCVIPYNVNISSASPH